MNGLSLMAPVVGEHGPVSGPSSRPSVLDTQCPSAHRIHSESTISTDREFPPAGGCGLWMDKEDGLSLVFVPEERI